MTPLEYYAGEVVKFVLIGMVWLFGVGFLIAYGCRHKKPTTTKKK